jgi:hypothetical protein
MSFNILYYCYELGIYIGLAYLSLEGTGFKYFLGFLVCELEDDLLIIG